ncbi:MAG TPA: cupin domain-containing protein [Agromyces sp.]|nr:cupin domain-containing protein [Agromyces sp.]
MKERRHALIAGNAEALIGVLEVEPRGIRSRRIFAGPGASVVRLSLADGEVLKEHIAMAPLLLQMLAGRAAITVADERVELGAGGLLHIDAQVPHAVEALEDAQVMLVLLGAKPSRQPRPEAVPSPRISA